MRIRLAGVVDDSIVDGRGMRLAVFAQGCPHGCAGCHNPGTHDPDGGSEADADDIIKRLAANPLLDGVTLTGGEPFAQAAACAYIAEGARALGLDVWVYTGYPFEELLTGGGDWIALLTACDVLIDGRFSLAERTLDVPFVGSRNQRVLDARASLREGRAVPLGD